MKKLIPLVLGIVLLLTVPATAFASETVQAQMADLPTVEEFKAMDPEAQREAYLRTQAVYDAYLALPEEEQAGISGVEAVFGPLFAHFSTLIDYAEETQAPQEPEALSRQGPRELALPILLAAAFLLGRRKKK